MAGCLAVPPDPTGEDGSGGDDGHMQPGGSPDGGDAVDVCVSGTELDLVWVSEVAFNHEAQDQVTLPGLMILVNSGPDPVELGSLTVMSPGDIGAVQGDFSLSGGDLSLPAGEAMGALNTGASLVLSEFDEEWTNLAFPELDAVLTFDGSGVDTEVPLHLEIGGYTFDLSIDVRHDPTSTNFDWARSAERTTAFCD
ncbi:MAG TPA: hypothetical protein VIG06_22245 [Kofleriaceae bacterium]